MNAELLKTYKQLEGMNQTEEVVQIKNQIKKDNVSFSLFESTTN